VRTLYQTGKFDNVILEMDRMGLQALGLCEIRWTGAGEIVKDNNHLFYSGGDTHQHGVGLILNRDFSKSVLSFWPKSERLLQVKLKASPFNLNIIVVYAPTAEAEEKDIDQFYCELNEVMKGCKSQEITIVMGDWNAKIGEGQENDVVGRFGLGQRNDRGDRMADWCTENGMVITNTLFQCHFRKRYTWTQPGDRAKNQIDFILINKRFRNAVKNSHAYPGADIQSDHNPVVAKVRLSLNRIQKPQNKRKLMLRILKEDATIRENFKKEVLNNIEEAPPESVQDHWNQLKTTISQAAEKHIPQEKARSRSSQWITKEIKDLMEQRRLLKGHPVQYDLVHNQIRKKCTEAKELWLENKCKEIENASQDPRTMFRKIKDLCGKRSAPSSRCIKDADGNVLHQEEEVSARWVQYVKALFDDNDPEDDDLHVMYQASAEAGPEILKDEIRWAIHRMKTDKAPGPDEIYTEMLVALDEEGVDLIWQICKKIYETGELPTDMLLSIFITLPKIPGTMECSNHRTISLMCHILKILLKIITNRVRRQLLPEISPRQYGFMKDRGTRNAVFVLRNLCERAIQHQQNVYCCFVDYAKAFDRVPHKRLFETLRNINIDAKDYRLLHKLYQNQTGTVRLPNRNTETFAIKRGVRQGCVASPDLFNLFSETILRRLDEVSEGLLVNGVRINNIRYADDTVIIADSEEGLQNLLNILNDKSEEYGMSINCKKTKCMVFSKAKISPKCLLKMGDETIEQVEAFNYLGSVVTCDTRCRNEIRRRLTLAKAAFNQLRSIFADRKMSTTIKIRLLKTYVWSVLLYGCESWTFTAETRKNVEAAEMWFYRRILRVSYMDRVTNDTVLERVHQKRQLLKIIEKRQMQFLGHSIRKGELEELSLSGKIPGRRARGRQRQTLLHNYTQGETRTHIQPSTIWQRARARQPLLSSLGSSRPGNGHDN